jgi:SNF2 family DNA or RNA helicase
MKHEVTIQHVFELVLRLKQICNFDPATGESSKFERLEADLEECVASGRKAIVFSQWVQTLAELRSRLARFAPVEYHGQILHRRREAVLERFRDDGECRVMLMTYGAGGVGLNLQFANYVFLFDRWWNPAVEDQAINRAHRIGQKEPVFVTRFVAQNTIEGRICEVLEKKRQLFSDLIDHSGTPSSMGLTEEEVFGLFDLKVRPRRAAA